MRSKIELKNEEIKISTLLDRIKEGHYAMPKIQRTYVWNVSKVKYLVQSLISGYPIGCLVIWRTKSKVYEDFRTETEHLVIPAFNKKHTDVNFVIDGQQRMSSLYALFAGEEVKNHRDRILPFNRMFWDHRAKHNNDWVVTLTNSDIRKEVRKNELVQLKALFNERCETENNRFARRVTEQRNMILNTYLPVLEIVDAPIEKMKEIFVRINSGGMKVSQVDELFAQTTGINLRDKVRKLIIESEREVKGYKNLPERLIFIMLAGTHCYREKSGAIKSKQKSTAPRLRTEAIKKAVSYYSENPSEFKGVWKRLETAFKKAALFLKEKCGVNSYEVLPTDGLLVVATLFHFWAKTPRSHGLNNLCELFWVASVQNRYSGEGYDEFLWDDVSTIYKIADGKNGKKVGFDFSSQSPRKLSDLAASNYREKTNIVKAVKCLLAHSVPRFLFSEEGAVSRAERFIPSQELELHHIFPDSLLEENGFKADVRNTLMNICLLPAIENQRISNKPPRVYLKDAKKVEGFPANAQSHLIPVGTSSGVWKKDVKVAFELFRVDRAKMIAKKFNEVSGQELFELE